MKINNYILFCFCAASTWFLPEIILGQVDATECRQNLAEALLLRNTPPPEGCSLYRKVMVTTVRKTTRGTDTVRVESETIEGGSIFVIRSDSTELRQDSTTLVVVDQRMKTIQIVSLDHLQDILAARQSLQATFSDSLPVHAQSVQCHQVGENQRISFVIPPERQRLYNARKITLDIRPDGEIIWFMMEHQALWGMNL